MAHFSHESRVRYEAASKVRVQLSLSLLESQVG